MPGRRSLEGSLGAQLVNFVHAAPLVAQVDFAAYRDSFPKLPEQSWWFLDKAVKAPKKHPTDWVFKGATTLAWAISIGLLVNISGRFLLGGAGVAGLSAIALSNLLMLLKARSDLTAAGNAVLESHLSQQI